MTTPTPKPKNYISVRHAQKQMKKHSVVLVTPQVLQALNCFGIQWLQVSLMKGNDPLDERCRFSGLT